MKQRNHMKVNARAITAVAVVTALLAVGVFCAWWFMWRDTRPKASPATDRIVAALTVDASDVDATGAIADDAMPTFTYASAALFLGESMAGENGNVNYSPASLWVALAIAAQGADGQTRVQLDKALGLDGLANEDYRSLMLSINGRYGDSRSRMRTANSLWLNESLAEPLQSFVDTTQQVLDAQVRTEPYGKRTTQWMSQWVSRQTEGMLKPQIRVSDNEAMSIIGTVYADGVWDSPFDPDHSFEQTFHGVDGDSQAMFMSQQFDSLPYLRDADNGWQRVDILFDNGGALSVILPDQGRFDDLAGDAVSLRDAFEADPQTVLAASDAEGFPPVTMQLPRFSVDNSFADDQVKTVLRNLGITDAFDANAADFSKMGTGKNGEPLFVGSVVQGTHIEVNEHGAKAAAFSKVGVDAAGAPEIPDNLVEFTVDRPFLFALTTPDGVPLFIGAIRNLLNS